MMMEDKGDMASECDLLRADIRAVADGDEFSFGCEACGAPLLCNADDFVMDDDGVCGCWNAMIENPPEGRPCYAYRVGKKRAPHPNQDTPHE